MGGKVVFSYRVLDWFSYAYYCLLRKKGELPVSEYGHSYDVVFKLISECNLVNKGYHLFVDNFCTSPTLAQSLYDKGVMGTGTLVSLRE